jgi:hypothetical protein
VRDPERIGPILERLRRVWEMHPDLRLGQIITNARYDRDVYYAEDEALILDIETLHPGRTTGSSALSGLLEEVATERARQDSIFGIQQLPDGTGGGGRKTWETIARNWCDRATSEGILTFADILDEEVSEALAETDPVKLRVELIQAAAVCLKWAQDLDRRARSGGA